jgi:hypothetical protein
MGDPANTRASFAYISSALKFSESAIALYTVDSKDGVFARMIQTVLADLDETERLLCDAAVKAALISTPAKLPWIKGAIVSTKTTLNETGRWLVEREGGAPPLAGDTKDEASVVRDREKLINCRGMELTTSHQTLSAVLGYLTLLEKGDDFSAGHGPPPEYYDATFWDNYPSPAPKTKTKTKRGDAEKSMQAFLPPAESKYGKILPLALLQESSSSG